MEENKPLSSRGPRQQASHTARGMPGDGFPEVSEKLVRCFCTFTEPPRERSISRRPARPSKGASIWVVELPNTEADVARLYLC